MKQYRITAQDFVLPGETGDADAVMDSADLQAIKRLAGITGLLESGAGMYAGVVTPQASEEGITSPVGSITNNLAQERSDLMKEFAVQPGTDLWFIINFTQPHLTGSLRAHVEDYLKKNPQYRPKTRPTD